MTDLDLPGMLSLGLVTLECLALGWLSGLSWPTAAPWGPRWALGAIVGATFIGFSLLLLGVLRVSFAWPPLPLAVAVVAASVTRWLIGRCNARSQSASGTCSEFAEGQLFGWVLFGVVLTAALIRAIVVPETGWDAYSHWGLKAEAYFFTGTIIDTHTAHEYYPPLVPLLESWIYVQRGAASIDLAKTIWAVVGVAFGICLAWHLRLSLAARSRWLAPALALAIILGTPQALESFWTGEADLALTVYLNLTVLALLRWCDSRERGWLFQAMLFGAAAALTKYEGMFRVGVVLVALGVEVVLQRRPALLTGAVAVAVASLAAYVSWAVFRSVNGIEVTSEHLSQFQPEAIGGVLVALSAALGGVRTGGGLVVVALGWVIAGKRSILPPLRFLTLVVVGQLTTTLLAFFFTADSPALQVQLSATRLFEQFTPIALFATAVWLVQSAQPLLHRIGFSHDPHNLTRRSA